MEKTIQLKASNRQLNSFEEAVEFCHNYKDSIHSNYIEPLDDDIRIRICHTVKKKYRSLNARR